jgi:formylglycine-generating enzyme required for sulfatase activity
MNCLSWYVAFAFCIFDGGRLPTEAEWEYAAAGGEKRRLYPWGAEQPHELLSNCNVGAASPFVPVGSTPQGAARWGHQDLAGSVWEWVLDFWAPYSSDPSVDDAVLSEGERRVMRGGGWRSMLEPQRTTFRGALAPDAGNDELGVRCAR